MSSSRNIYTLVVCCFFLALQFNETSGSFLDWIWPNRNVELFESSIQMKNLPNVKFELSENDEKFIEDSSKLVGRKLSQADFCQQRVILNLKSSCKSLTDEQLRKLSVDLFNCQLQAESRPSHECSENMPLEDCTSSMSPEELSTYNKIHDQSKQLCLSIRQDQFRGLTELTINKLVTSTHQHLDLMGKLQNSQQLLEKATLSSLDEITDSHMKLLDQQQEILKMSEFQRQNSEANMREILKEKSLLKIGNSELNSFILNMKQKIQEGLSGVHSQNQETKEAFTTLLADFEQLNIISSRITLKLEEITEEISEKGEENYALLETTKRQIEQVHEVAEETFDFIMKLKEDFNDKFKWIEIYFGKDDTTEKVAIMLIHIATLLIGMLCLVFVGADYVTRYLFLGLIGVNMTLNLMKIYDLNIGILIQTIGLLLIGDVATKFYIKYNLTQILKMYISKIRIKFTKKPVGISNYNVSTESTPMKRREDHNMTNGQRTIERHRYMASRESVESTNSVSSRRSNGFQQCSATTMKGTQCSLSAINNYGLCTIHARSSRDRER